VRGEAMRGEARRFQAEKQRSADMPAFMAAEAGGAAAGMTRAQLRTCHLHVPHSASHPDIYR
jgi:hypothetical protein